MSFAKKDVVEASGSLQLCAGKKSGSEAAIHAMNTLFEDNDIDAVLLIDASNAFNALNRTAPLHNIRVLCPIIAAYAINTYRQPARLFIVGGKEIASAEGTTQGDPLAIAFYAISTLPLITSLQAASTVKQCWYRRRSEWSWSCDTNQSLMGCIEYSWSKPGIFSERREMLDYC